MEETLGLLPASDRGAGGAQNAGTLNSKKVQDTPPPKSYYVQIITSYCAIKYVYLCNLFIYVTTTLLVTSCVRRCIKLPLQRNSALTATAARQRVKFGKINKYRNTLYITITSWQLFHFSRIMFAKFISTPNTAKMFLMNFLTIFIGKGRHRGVDWSNSYRSMNNRISGIQPHFRQERYTISRSARRIPHTPHGKAPPFGQQALLVGGRSYAVRYCVTSGKLYYLTNKNTRDKFAYNNGRR